MDKDQLIKERETAIGGSDIAALFDLSPWKSKHDIFMRLTGNPDETETTEAMDIGNWMEPIIMSWYAKETGLKVETDIPAIYHPEYNFLVAHLDGRASNGSGIPFKVVEAKNVGIRNFRHWGEGDEIPAFYNLQVQHYMWLSDLGEADVAASLAGTKRKIYNIKRSDRIIQKIEEVTCDFYNNHVLTRIPPPVDSSKGASKMLQMLYPNTLVEEVTATSEVEETIKSLYDAREEEVKIKDQINLFHNQIKKFMGNAGTLKSEQGFLKLIDAKGRKTIDTKTMISDLNLSDEEVAKYTKIGKSSRRFNDNFKKNRVL